MPIFNFKKKCLGEGATVMTPLEAPIFWNTPVCKLDKKHFTRINCEKLVLGNYYVVELEATAVRVGEGDLFIIIGTTADRVGEGILFIARVPRQTQKTE